MPKRLQWECTIYPKVSSEINLESPVTISISGKLPIKLLRFCQLFLGGLRSSSQWIGRSPNHQAFFFAIKGLPLHGLSEFGSPQRSKLNCRPDTPAPFLEVTLAAFCQSRNDYPRDHAPRKETRTAD